MPLLRLSPRQYFELCVAAIKAVDPNHLVIGSRFGYQPHPNVIAAAGRYLDVISFNRYDFDPGAVIDAYSAGGKPCLISEFSFRGDDSGLPNSRGAGPRVESQLERAQCFERYVTAALKKPAVVGYHWFEHADQPAEGRFDGENSNFGTVTIEDDDLCGADGNDDQGQCRGGANSRRGGRRSSPNRRSRQLRSSPNSLRPRATTAMVRNTLDGLTLIESMPEPVR